jgi:hypothetical protein
MSKAPEYPFEMRPLTAEEGGGLTIVGRGAGG